MSLAADTRTAVRKSPLLFDALRAGVINYAAAARSLDIDGETEAVTAALRRFADDLEPRQSSRRSARVTMHSGLERSSDGLLSVGDGGFGEGQGELTAVIATGEVDPVLLEHILGVLRIQDITVEAAGTTRDSLVVVVNRRDGAETLRRVESILESSRD